jgi:ABC-2 type transport system permease protein
MDMRNKHILIVYYIVPIFFFLLMSGIFSSVMPEYKATLVPSMAIFAVTMGAMLGTPVALIEVYSGDILKSYKTGRVPLRIPLVNNFISAFLNLFAVSLVILAVAPLAFGAQLPQNMGLYFLSLICFLLASVSIGTVMGLFVKSSAKLTLIGQAIFLPSVMLAGIMFPASMLPEALQYVSLVLPATLAFKGMTDFHYAYPLALVGIAAVMTALALIKLRFLSKR